MGKILTELIQKAVLLGRRSSHNLVGKYPKFNELKTFLWLLGRFRVLLGTFILDFMCSGNAGLNNNISYIKWNTKDEISLILCEYGY